MHPVYLLINLIKYISPVVITLCMKTMTINSQYRENIKMFSYPDNNFYQIHSWNLMFNFDLNKRCYLAYIRFRHYLYEVT